MTRRNLGSGETVTQGRSGDGPCQQPPRCCDLAAHPAPGKPASRHRSTPRHRKGSSPSEIPDNAAVPITTELFQAFTSAHVLLHAPSKVGLNSISSSTEAPSPELRKKNRSTATAFSPLLYTGPKKSDLRSPKPTAEAHSGTALGLQLCRFAYLIPEVPQDSQ